MLEKVLKNKIQYILVFEISIFLLKAYDNDDK